MTITSSAGSGIAQALGAGSGLDIASLVSGLAAAQKAPAEALVAGRETANKAKVSALATITSSIDGFASALSALVGGGTLFTQPATSDPAAVAASPIAGARIAGGLAASIQVVRLAQAQTLASAPVADPAASVGHGTLTLSTGAGTAAITIDAGNDSLAGLAAAISGAGVGLAASVVTDGAGARLVVKGATGAAAAFTIGADPALAAFAYDGAGGGMTRAQAAQDASLVLDGVAVTRPSNTVDDLVPGVKLQLKAVSSGPVAIGATQPVAAMRQAVLDFVDAYNEVKGTLDTATASGVNGGAAGPFGKDGTVRGLQRQLAGLTSTPLVASGSVATLADLGVRTGQDGALSVDTATLDGVLARDPAGVAALFNPVQRSTSPKVEIRSAIGAAPPGTYRLTDLVAGPPPAGKLNGVDMIVAGTRLVAPVKSGAGGLVLSVTGDVAEATVTVEPGLGGALKAIRDTLRGSGGPLQTLGDALARQAKAIADDRTAMQARADAYQARLQTTFAAMNTRVTAFKATQSYLAQQIKVWTNDTNG